MSRSPDVPRPEYITSFQTDRCLPACVSMALLTHGIVLDDESLNQLTGYEPGLNSQFSLATLGLAQYIPGVRLYSWLNFTEYAQHGADYLAQVFPPEWLAHQASRSSPGFKREQAAAQAIIDQGLTVRLPEDPKFIRWQMIDLINSQHVLIPSVDAGVLYDSDLMSAHAVFVWWQTGRYFMFLEPDPIVPEEYSFQVAKSRLAAAVRTHIIAIPKN